MNKPPSDRCGYTWPEDYEVGDRPEHQSCCYRETFRDCDHCVWHVDPVEVNEKPVEAFRAAQAPAEIREQNSPYDELLDGAKLPKIGLDNSISFKRAALRNADLSMADFYKIDLTEADLRYTNFTDVNFLEVTLDKAILFRAALDNAILEKSNLSNASLGRASLTNANLGDSNLTGANLEVADLTDVSLRDANLSDASLWGANLTNASLREADFTDTDLRSTDLTDAHLFRATLVEADLENAILENTDLTKAMLAGSNLESATLTHANLAGSDLSDAKLDNAQFWGVSINDETEFGEWCAYERDVDPVGPPPESDDSPTGITSFVSGRLARKWYGFKAGFGRLRDDWSLSDDERDDKIESLTKAISIYRARQRLYRDNSLPGKIGKPYVREKHCRQKLAFISGRAGRWLVWPKWVLKRWVMLYGESPWRVIYTSLVVILISAVVYQFLGGVAFTEGETTSTAETFAENLYFSAITFSTLGYANVHPDSTSAQLLASAQSLLGGAMVALLVVVLGRRVMR